MTAELGIRLHGASESLTWVHEGFTEYFALWLTASTGITTREYFADIPPSSPSIALFKAGELVYFVPRHRIESRSAEEVAADLSSAFDRYFATAPAS